MTTHHFGGLSLHGLDFDANLLWFSSYIDRFMVAFYTRNNANV